jgi:hypothetical protein
VTELSGLREAELVELHLRAYLEVQRDQEAQGAMPRSGQDVLSRFRVVFECLGAIQVGLLVACVTILLNFLIVVVLLHLDVSRYLGFLFSA